jgi:hypothetical protein
MKIWAIGFFKNRETVIDYSFFLQYIFHKKKKTSTKNVTGPASFWLQGMTLNTH